MLLTHKELKRLQELDAYFNSEDQKALAKEYQELKDTLKKKMTQKGIESYYGWECKNHPKRILDTKALSAEYPKLVESFKSMKDFYYFKKEKED